jgi:hypothetical protein
MLYAMLCYNNEEAVFAWSKEQNDAVIGKLAAVESKLKQQGRMGSAARLMPTSAAMTLRTFAKIWMPWPTCFRLRPGSRTQQNDFLS